MYEVATRELPARSLLCLCRHVEGQQAVFALGKEAIAIFKERPLPQLEGIAGASFLIYHGEVSDDSDGPVEWCRPLPENRAVETAAGYPELTLRSEPAHEEAFVHLGFAPDVSAADWELISESLRTWVGEQRRQPSDLGLRITYLVTPPITADSRPDCDFALPLC